ncbi:MAG: hypothetical protein ACT4PT_03595 [Methanobacteriota archaeon]
MTEKRISLLANADLFDRIEKYRTRFSIRNRSDAVRILIHRGLEDMTRDAMRPPER